ncbi:hypothetical protein B0J17DRAFT_569691 [Rhizoctonia solani]|nr:hypothetical protein B0J17DRAFT_569691 [Rhizoctonia solani]
MLNCGRSGIPPGRPSPFAPPGPLTARPHVCELCDSGFARAHDLKRHLETHKGERPHKCPNCQRSFSRKDAVRSCFFTLSTDRPNPEWLFELRSNAILLLQNAILQAIESKNLGPEYVQISGSRQSRYTNSEF